MIRGECGAAPGAPCRNDGDRQRCDSRRGTHAGPFHVKHLTPSIRTRDCGNREAPARLQFAPDYPGPRRLAPNGDVHPGAASSRDRSARVRSLSVSRGTSHSLARAHDSLGSLPIRTSTAGEEAFLFGTIVRFQDTSVSRQSSRPAARRSESLQWAIAARRLDCGTHLWATKPVHHEARLSVLGTGVQDGVDRGPPMRLP